MGDDTLDSIENVVLGSGNDTITGSGSANIIEGGRGNDILDGKAVEMTSCWVGPETTSIKFLKAMTQLLLVGDLIP